MKTASKDPHSATGISEKQKDNSASRQILPAFLQHHPILKVRSDGQAEEELGIYLWQDHTLIARIETDLASHYHA